VEGFDADEELNGEEEDVGGWRGEKNATGRRGSG